MGCCDHREAQEGFASGSGKDLSNGPITERRCTDRLCIVVYALHWLAFFIVTFLGARNGDIRRLYRPRDFKGAYCGLAHFSGYAKQMQMMNTSLMVEPIAQQVICSSSSAGLLGSIMSTSEYEDYLCNCCLMPCKRCDAALGLEDLSDPVTIASTITGSMSQLTDPLQTAALFSSGSVTSNVEDIFNQATKYFIPVCVQPRCAMPMANSSNGTARSYRYAPDPDSMYKGAWDALLTHPSVPDEIRNAMSNQFTFTAVPSTYCPYDAKYCIPMPGMNFTEAAGDYCLPVLDSSVQNALGAAAVSVLQGAAANSLAANASTGLGGELFTTLDALILVVFWSFMIGLVFMILLRFFVGCFVWASLALVLFFMLFGGCMAFVRSSQCAGTDLLESGQDMAVAVVVAAASTAHGKLQGSSSCSEAMTGDGSDYRGCQTRTRSGRHCQMWDVQGEPHNHTYTSANYPNSSLEENYCRNPANSSTIWCITTNIEKLWETCSPVGVVLPECPGGYKVDTQDQRDALKICAYVVWSLGGIWVLLVVCMYSRIRLAIALNKVAAMFIQHTPMVLVVPVLQIGAALSYGALWALSASFLVSQVPAGYTSAGWYTTWEEAMGNATTPGKCNPKWPQGFAWKDGGDLTAVDSPCSGDRGNTTGIVPRCFRCAPPRYTLDYMFAYSFFSYLWNNAFIIAMGQCIIAGAVGAWFFTQNKEKGRTSPVWQAVKITLRYHLGSLAFGAFIIAVVQFIRYVLMYCQKQAEAQKNRVVQLLLKILQLCLWCFEKCLKFLNKNAYIQIALLGKNFCTSAKNAFFLIVRNAARFATMTVLGSIIQFIGNAIIVTASTLSGYFILQFLHPKADPVLPVIAYFAVSYVIAKLYMNVFGLSVDASLQCFIAAEEQKLVKDCVPRPLRALMPTKSCWESSTAVQVLSTSPSAK